MLAPPTPAVVTGPQQEAVKVALEASLTGGLRPAMERCRAEALAAGARTDELNRPIRFVYTVNGQTRAFERLELTLDSEAHQGYSICVLGRLQELGPVLPEPPSTQTFPGSAVLAPSLHCPVGSLGCACNVDGTCASGRCDGRACVEEYARPSPEARQNVTRDGLEFTLLRCVGLLNAGNAQARCTLGVRALVRDMDFRVGGAGGGGQCANASSVMYDNFNLEHRGVAASFAGMTERACVLSRLVQGIQAQVEVQFDNVPPYATTVALLAVHASVREVGMPDWRQVPLEFRGIRIDR